MVTRIQRASSGTNIPKSVKENMPSLRGEKQNTLRTHKSELVSAGEEGGRQDLGVNTYDWETAGIVKL